MHTTSPFMIARHRHDNSKFGSVGQLCMMALCHENDILIAGDGNSPIMIWESSPRYWPFVRGIHHPMVGSPHKGQSWYWNRLLITALLWRESTTQWWFPSHGLVLWYFYVFLLWAFRSCWTNKNLQWFWDTMMLMLHHCNVITLGSVLLTISDSII